MSILRFDAVKKAQNRDFIKVTAPAEKISDYFGCNVFNDAAMKQYLSAETYKKLKNAIAQGQPISLDLADNVAVGMKNWAMSKGVTHYTHWFQPLTGLTAEKHDAFFDLEKDGTVLEKFKGTALAQQEPDASSFPSGGIRSTFEARGYTAWDATSPAFIMEDNGTKTLCIPTVFVSYTGEALDFKMPLLKALQAVDKAATAVAQYFEADVTHTIATLGPEQEYFLVDKAMYYARPDLVSTGRTLFGHTPPKGQQLEDHYFGSIPSRVKAFMVEFEIECLKLGIPIRTRHNEVAPGQFECASTFEEANLAVDHNLLLMDVMHKVADRHNLKVLFHEKPFSGINGSGKHNNWSLQTNTGINLLSPSTKAKDNLRFLTFFVNVIRAVYQNADLLRASIMSAGNEHRLGANEAPPSIISVFVGSQMSEILEELESKAVVKVSKGENIYMKTGINKIPPVLLDNTDRNRTSPFAFTGNKFEFRAVGSSANCSSNMIVLNTIVANQLTIFKAEVEKRLEKGDKKEVVIINILKEYIKESKSIIFEGDGYSDAWKEEAQKRGLTNIASCIKSLEAFISEKTVHIFEENQVLSHRELEARYEILLENYIKEIQIESRMMGELVVNHVIPTSISYQNKLVEYVRSLKAIGIEDTLVESTLTTVHKIAGYVNDLQNNVKAMIDTRKVANNTEDLKKRAEIYSEQVKSYFEPIRYAVDKLELTISDEAWPLAKYRELLMIR
ncbi:MAG: glutamine synthetase III [Thermonemataceae bacterium]|nr:glutamine synthetase III [Thermonemataceae bacterium]